MSALARTSERDCRTWTTNENCTASESWTRTKYLYDGNGLRVTKKSGANSDCTGGTIVKLYWRSLSGDALAESDSSGSTTNAAYNEYVFFAGRRVGSRNGTGAIFYWFADHLGTTRSITTGNGPGQTTGQLCYDADFTPYGQEMSHSEHLQAIACPPNYKFTGYERDPETGLDYAFARYYSSSLGRFYSTDPLGGSIGSLQSHNAYAYTANNPTNRVDPLGLFFVDCSWDECYFGPGGGDYSGSIGPPGVVNYGWTWDQHVQQTNAWLASGSIPWFKVVNGHLMYAFRAIDVIWIPNVLRDPDSPAGVMVVTNTWVDLGTLTEAFYGDGSNTSFALGALQYQAYVGNRAVKQLIIQAPGARVQGTKYAAKWGVCGKDGLSNIGNYMYFGATKGAAWGFYVESEFGGPWLGALEGGVEGFFLGAASGIMATAACQAYGEYN